MQVRHTRAAFTLTEMLVVVAIIVVLAGIGGYFLLPALDRAKDDAAKAQTHVIEAAAMDYYLKHDSQYPGSLDVLTQQDEANDGKPYLSHDAIIDPWKQQYQFNPDGPHNSGGKPDVWTKNPKGKEIGNWGK
jgi:prepilin-type N-terminal cleavage/methylation domain-containing protein